MWPLLDNDPFIDAMLDSRGDDKAALDKQVRSVLRKERFKHALAPWLRFLHLPRFLVTTLYEIIRRIITLEDFPDGRHRSASSQVHGGADQASGGSAGGAAPNYAALTAATRSAFQAAAAGPSPLLTAFDAPQPAIEDAGIKAGEIVGYRCWRLRDGLLCSCYLRYTVWQPGEIMEGDPDQGEGVHAFKDRLMMGSYGYRYVHEGYGEVIVSGTVYLWGDVIEHERGYRASKAAIASIDDSPHYDAKALRKRYGLTKKRGKKK